MYMSNRQGLKSYDIPRHGMETVVIHHWPFGYWRVKGPEFDMDKYQHRAR